jgi:protein TonB
MALAAAVCRHHNSRRASLHRCQEIRMKKVFALVLCPLLFACATPEEKPAPGAASPTGGQASAAATLDGYKAELARHIAASHPDKVFTGRPQGLLRSVVVARFVVDAHGKLMRSEIMRSNRDATTEATTLATLRNSAPFPRPAAHLLQRGRLELTETWLFNSDGRFQLRSIAERQMDR